jgi:hypothetical protein
MNNNIVEDHIKIHDQFQFEIKLSYKLKKEDSNTSYNIDTFLFVPVSLGINKLTYSNRIFFKDLQGYIRFKTPALLLKEIVNGDFSPFGKLVEAIANYVEKKNEKSEKNYKYHLKMFLSIVKSSMRDHVRFICKSQEEDVNKLIKEFIFECEKITSSYRKTKDMVNVPLIGENAMEIYKAGDEFLSLYSEINIFRLLEFLKKHRKETYSEFKDKLLSLATRELEYRINNNYAVVNPDSDNEQFIYRRNMLKKFIGSALFLKTRKDGEGKLLEQIIMGTGAGLAMIFATVVAFYAQKRFGSYTFPLFVALVVSYIFKDRIKELSRTYLINKFNSRLFDLKTYIFGENNKKIGVCREAMRFIKKEKLPQDVFNARNIKIGDKDETSLWREEKIIHYRKRITLHSSFIKDSYPNFNINGVNDIVRYSLARFTAKMDDPDKIIYYLKDNEVLKKIGTRMYYLNLILKFSRDNKSFLKRFVIAVNRDGINRIEEIYLP